MIKAHGVTYTTVEQAREAIADLQAKNDLHGPSDGRVTEINAIKDALAEHLIANPPKVHYATYTVVERDAFTPPAPKKAPAVAEQPAPAEHVVVDDEDGRWTVLRGDYQSPCEHPQCALLHRRFFEGTEERREWVSLPNGEDRLVTVRGWHEKTNRQWVILRNGVRVGDAHDTKRDALREAAQKPRH